MKVKVESEKVGLKLNIQKTKIMASGPITSWERDGETVQYYVFSFSISPNEYSGLISFRTNWFGLLAAQGTLKSLLQPCNSKTSILRHSAFFMVQLSHPYLTTGKTIALTI